VTDEKNCDPTKAADFQKVIRHFVTTPHKPHGPLKPKVDQVKRKTGALRAKKKSPQKGA
jgi:hypothetical protein